jgi:hypothetical protein
MADARPNGKKKKRKKNATPTRKKKKWRRKKAVVRRTFKHVLDSDAHLCNGLVDLIGFVV